ncbi:MAG: hypothetical protein LGB07_01990 [Sulfurovum sp.]|nr:hypothetical protein [Sulfurovum sp.]MCB4744410.1 hypothetical protein [Sulfurovum sp.]MCB4745870.1 hypothetical protein [Sulfurovum sp.]MCB4747564.1 hypothetical protein [Sulfurovum sp.]MCB4748937.1 hypothetical protein [Sulfurovum sp.]
MIIKFIIFAMIGIFIYRLMGGKLPIIDIKNRPKTKKKPDGDTLVDCSKCGTYVMIEEATLIGGKYCCDECV